MTTTEVIDMSMRPALTAQDRCDRCGAQAHAVTLHDAGELLWCAHHYRKHSDQPDATTGSVLGGSLIFMTSNPFKPTKEPAKA